MSAGKTLVLWDIDHTLITIGGLSRDIYADAFRSATGQVMRQLADMTGRTERAIAADTLRLHHIEASDQLLHSFGLALAESFLTFEEAIRERGQVLDGALEALAMLAGHPDVVQSVLTGNMEPIAIGKLRAFDLDRFVDFDAGAYGMDHEERPELVRLAQQRATAKYGHAFTAANTVLIGDTPNDVLAGHLGGARVVAVATGSCSADTLREAGSELVLTDLSDTPAVIHAILGVADEAQ